MRKISEKMGRSPCGLLTQVFSLAPHSNHTSTNSQLRIVTLHFKGEYSKKKKKSQRNKYGILEKILKEKKGTFRGKGERDIRYTPENYISLKPFHRCVAKRYKLSIKLNKIFV